MMAARAERRRAHRSAGKLWRHLDKFEQQTGRVIEGQIIRPRVDPRPDPKLLDVIADWCDGASRDVMLCMRCRARLRPPASWPQAFFVAHGAFGLPRSGRVLVMAVCDACAANCDEALFQDAHAAMVWVRVRRISAASLHRAGGRA